MLSYLIIHLLILLIPLLIVIDFSSTICDFMLLVSDSVMPASVVTFRASNYAQVYKTDMLVFDTIYSQ